MDTARPAGGLDHGEAVGALRRLPAAVRRHAPAQDSPGRRAVRHRHDASAVVLASALQAAQTALQVGPPIGYTVADRLSTLS